jgi:hypothetical protein
LLQDDLIAIILRNELKIIFEKFAILPQKYYSSQNKQNADKLSSGRWRL